MKIAILSDGGWGTSLAILLSKHGHAVTMWGPFAANLDLMRSTRRNDQFLKGAILPPEMQFTTDMAAATATAEVIVMAAPTLYARKCLQALAVSGGYHGQMLVNVAKGIEVESLKRPSELVQEIIGPAAYVCLSGPSHAEEVWRDVPTAVVAASSEPELAKLAQQVFMGRAFRVYTSDDVAGVELGGALKNIFAIAAGISDGMRLGDNAKAALITRGIAEMGRLGETLGGRRATFAGLSGLGDMIVTCCSGHSRNRHVGEELGKGFPLPAVLQAMGKVVAEGVKTTESAYQLARKVGARTPIIDEVYATLYEGKDSRQALHDLMLRGGRAEAD